jgi:capsular exopolysaccharide synthesis family protein
MSSNTVAVLKGLEAPDSPTYQNLFQIAARRVSLLVLAVLLMLGLGTMYYIFGTQKFESQASIAVVKRHPDALISAQGSEFRDSAEDYVGSHANIIKSPVVVSRALRDIKARNPSALGWYEKLARGHDTDLLREVTSAILVTRDTKDVHNNVLDLSFRDTDREECTEVLYEVIQKYKAFLGDSYQNVSNRTVELITNARLLIEKDLVKKETDYREFRKNIPVALYKGKEGNTFNRDHLLAVTTKHLDYQVRSSAVEQRLETITRAIENKASREELIAMVSQMASKTDPEASTKVPSALLEDKLLPALLEEKALLEEYGPRNPQVLAARRKVELAQKYVIECLRQELNDLKLSQRSIKEVLNQETEMARKAVVYEILDEDYRKDIDRTQRLYDDTLKRLEEVNLVKSMGGFEAEVLGEPTLGKKVSPLALLVFPASIFVGLVSGFGLAYVVELSDKSFRSAEEIRRRLEYQVIAHVPRIEPDRALTERAAVMTPVLSPMLISYFKPKSRLAESYRGVRTALYFSTQGEGHKVIQVTSPNPGDGKSTLTANLAVSIARSGKSVLLLDADLRKPTVEQTFGVSNKIGLSSLISRQAEIKDAIQKTVIAHLSVMPCGPIPSNPAELLTSPRFQELLDTLRDQFDFILVDTPPLLAVTDPAVVAPRVDGVILVIRITKKGRPDAERCKEILNTLDANVIGVVVNGQEVKSGYGGYGYASQSYSSEGYTYGEGSYYGADGGDDGAMLEDAVGRPGAGALLGAQDESLAANGHEKPAAEPHP